MVCRMHSRRQFEYNVTVMESTLQEEKLPIPTAGGQTGLSILKGLAQDRSLLTAMEAMHDDLGSIFQITMPRF